MGMNINTIKGKIKLITGLHIGAGNDEIHIGGIDNPVIKDAEGFPYIPGSSLKGKMRALLEMTDGLCPSGEPSTTKSFPNSWIPKMFGDTTGSNVTRLIFRDAFISEESKNKLIEKAIPATEAKSENSINRIKGVAGNPRVTERALAGLEFDFEVGLRVFDEDDIDEIIKVVRRGIDLLERDALGGSGSRGYGKVKFKDLTLNGEILQ